MKILNLALSCNDAILKMIPKYCPNLEWLNATCKYERVNQGGNATSFTISVTDVGLACLCNCKKLKILTINDPRSAVRGLRNSSGSSNSRYHPVMNKIQKLNKNRNLQALHTTGYANF